MREESAQQAAEQAAERAAEVSLARAELSGTRAESPTPEPISSGCDRLRHNNGSSWSDVEPSSRKPDGDSTRAKGGRRGRSLLCERP